jgi:DNA repair protein RecO (recombination protein O)
VDRFTDEAIVLSTLDYGEADRIVTLFTLGRGRLTAFAAGARKSKRRFPGAFEAGNHLNAQLVARHGDTYRLDGATIVKSFYQLRDDLSRIARALYGLELCRELTRDHQAHPELFNLVLGFLGRLDRNEAGPSSLLAFELEALAMAGYRPRFSPCALCGNPIGERPRFDPDAGGVACDNCAHRVPQSVPVAAVVVTALAGLQEGNRTPLSADVRARGRELLNVFIQYHLGRRLKSVDFMTQVGTD